MPGKLSAGLLLYRHRDDAVEVLLAHMGGPFWARKDDGAWTIPKGEPAADEDLFVTAQREFAEELGAPAPVTDYRELGSVRQSGSKVVTAWAVEADFDPDTAVSNTFELVWPRGSGRIQAFPEIDRVAWFDLDVARAKVVRAQTEFLDRLVALLEGRY